MPSSSEAASSFVAASRPLNGPSQPGYPIFAARWNGLTLSDERNTSFADVAASWLNSVRHALKPASISRREVCIAGLSPFFAGIASRNINLAHCNTWVERRGSKLSSSSFVKEPLRTR